MSLYDKLSKPTVTTTKTYDHSGDSVVSVRSVSNSTNWWEAPRQGILIEAGHASVGTYVKKISLPLNKTGTPTGNYTFAIRDSSETIKGSATGVANNLTTSYVITEVTLNTPVLIEVGDHVTIEYDNTAPATGKLSFPTSSSGWVANTDQQNWISSAWQGDGDGAGAGRKWQFTFDSTPTIGGLSNQRFVENFSGGSLDTDRWQQTQSGTGIFAMSDSVDGGFTLYPASGNTNYAQINFNNKKHYSKTGSVLISVWKQPTNTGGASTMQMASSNGTSWNTNSCGTRLWTTDSYFKLRTADASTVSQTDTTVARDTNFNLFKHEMKSSSAELSINGVFQLSKTTNLPTSDLQPAPFAWNENGNRDYLHIRYMEAYNT